MNRASTAAAAADPAALFAAVKAAFDGDPAVAVGGMFGSESLKHQGKVFAMLTKGQLVAKLPRERVAALQRAGGGAPFDPGHGRVIKEWVVIAPGDAAEWIALAQEARALVRGD